MKDNHWCLVWVETMTVSLGNMSKTKTLPNHCLRWLKCQCHYNWKSNMWKSKWQESLILFKTPKHKLAQCSSQTFTQSLHTHKHTHARTHAHKHACTCTHAHAQQDIIIAKTLYQECKHSCLHITLLFVHLNACLKYKYVQCAKMTDDPREMFRRLNDRYTPRAYVIAHRGPR